MVALPYRSTNDTSSGAVRLALASHRPVLTTEVPVFADVADAVVQVRRGTPGAIARGLSRLLDDPAEAARLAERGAARARRDGFAVAGRTYAKFVAAAFADLSPFERPYSLEPKMAPAVGLSA